MRMIDKQKGHGLMLKLRPQDKIEELQAQISAAMADTQELTARNTAWEAELQVMCPRFSFVFACTVDVLTRTCQSR